MKNSTFLSSMRDNLIKEASKKRALLLLFTLFGLAGQAQTMNVTVTNPTNTTPNLAPNYTSFDAALTALNGISAMSGPITLTLSGTETAPTTGLTIGSATLNPLLSATNMITILGTGATLNAGTGASLPTSAVPDGMLKLVGADWVTINGLTFTDGNTADPTVAMEYGLGLFKASDTDGCQNNTVKNCIFNMQSVNNTNTGGSALMPQGSSGIIMVSVTPDAATTALAPTAVSGANSKNKFQHNIISGGHNGISLFGYNSASATSTYSDYDNEVGGDSPDLGNTITGFGGTSLNTVTARGVNTANQYDQKIAYNIISNLSVGENNKGNVRGITAVTYNTTNKNDGASATIDHNTISLLNGGTTQAIYGIECTLGYGYAGNTIAITNNTLKDFSYPTATSPTLYGIYTLGTASNVNLNNNTIKDFSFGVSTQTTGSPNFYAIANAASNPATSPIQTYTANNNTISNIRILNQPGNIYGIYNVNATITCDGNIITDLSLPNTNGTGSRKIYGIQTVGGTTNDITETYTNNIIKNFEYKGTGSGTTNELFGIKAGAGSTNYKNTVIIHHNTISNLASNTPATASVRGIYMQSSKTASIYNNKIYNFSSDGATTGTTATVVGGIFVSGCDVSATVYNNIIGDFRSPNNNSTGGLCGMNIAGGAPKANVKADVFNNTIYLNGTSSSATDFGSKALIANATTDVTLQNNIVVNNSVAKGAGKSIAFEIQNTSATVADIPKYNVASNNNLLYGSSTFTFLGSGFTDEQATLADFKAYVGPTRDSNSISENPSFISTIGSDTGFLHIDPNFLTSIDGAGISVPTVTTDFDGIARANTPDIGADEFEPVKKLVVTPTICSSTADLTAATITAGSSSDLTYTYWTDAAATVAVTTPTTATVGKYYIKAAHATVSGNAIKAVTIAAPPSMTITNPAAFCTPGSADITAAAVTAGSESGLTLSYWTNIQATTALANPQAVSTAGQYYIKGISATTGCSVVRPVDVLSNSPYGFNVNTPAAVCAPNTVSITGVTQGPPMNTYTYWTDAAATTAVATPAAVATSGTYYIKATDDNGCTLVKPVTVTVNAAPVLTTHNTAAFCTPGSADITAAAVTAGSESGLTLSYWTNIQATTALANPQAVSTAGQYYIKGISATTGCSVVRPVDVLSNSPYGFNVNTPAAVCAPNTVSITGVTQGPPMNTYTYWTDAAATTAVATPAAVATSGTYYIKATDDNGCTLVKPVTVTVNEKVTPTFTQPAPICYGTALPVIPTTSGNITGTWAPAFDNTMTMDYVFTPTAGQCATNGTITITVNPMVSAPTGNAQQELAQGKTINDIVIEKDSNGVITWYASEANALAGTPALDPSTELTEGNYYAMQSIDGCTSTTPFVVAVTVTEPVMGINDFNMQGLRYFPNPVRESLNISYTHEIKSIEMFNLLGQHIMSVRPNAVSAKIEMGDLPIGTYLLQVNSEEKSTMIKVIKD